MSVRPPLLALNEVRFGFPNRPDFLGPVSLSIDRGQCWGIVGPNGAGKSTLLRLMAGLHTPHAGDIRVDGVRLDELSPKQRAQRLAWVPQQAANDLALTVRDVVLMGRFPHRSLGLFESPHDHRIAERAMMTTKTLEFADRVVSTLSGGEAQRAHLAAALAQEPDLLLLDEPMASVDLHHQLTMWRLLRECAEQRSMAVVVVTHDINLSARFCSHLAVMSAGQCVAIGEPLDVIAPTILEPVFGVKMVTLVVNKEVGDPPTYVRWIVPVRLLDEAET